MHEIFLLEIVHAMKSDYFLEHGNPTKHAFDSGLSYFRAQERMLLSLLGFQSVLLLDSLFSLITITHSEDFTREIFSRRLSDCARISAKLKAFYYGKKLYRKEFQNFFASAGMRDFGTMQPGHKTASHSFQLI